MEVLLALSISVSHKYSRESFTFVNSDLLRLKKNIQYEIGEFSKFTQFCLCLRIVSDVNNCLMNSRINAERCTFYIVRKVT